VYSSLTAPAASKSWEEETGLYREVKARLLGDFVLIGRFGGKYGHDEHDASKILFRYVGHTAFLTEGVVELRKDAFDIMQRYKHNFEEDSFAMELEFESLGPGPSAGLDASATTLRLWEALPEKVWPVGGKEGRRAGVWELGRMHRVASDFDHVQHLRRAGYAEDASKLALALGNNRVEAAVAWLGRLAEIIPVHRPQVPGEGGREGGAEGGEDQAQSHRRGGGEEGRRTLRGSSSLPSLGRSGDGQGTGSVPLSPGSRLCAVCESADPAHLSQLFVCLGCRQAFHTFCAKIPAIPYSCDHVAWEAYVRRRFAAWRCPGCLSRSALGVEAWSQRPIGEEMRAAGSAVKAVAATTSSRISQGVDAALPVGAEWNAELKGMMALLLEHGVRREGGREGGREEGREGPEEVAGQVSR
jgi:hypothetical protein